MSSEIEAVVREAEESKMFGNITLDYQDGKLVLIRKTSTFRPASAQNFSAFGKPQCQPIPLRFKSPVRLKPYGAKTVPTSAQIRRGIFTGAPGKYSVT